MTVTTDSAAGEKAPAVVTPPPVDTVTITIDGVELQVPKNELIIRSAERIGTQIPRFCDHPLLAPVGACRQCIVEVEGQRKPVASCTVTVTDGMVIHTQKSSPVAEKAQRGVMELLLINHPLDCPVCDKGGECPLQNQAMSTGAGESRFEGLKRTFPKPINISSQVLLDRERCVSCARCTRFADQIAGDPFITLIERGSDQQVGISVAEDQDFASYFSGNTVQICPVGALTGAAYRFRSRPFDLVSSPSACEHCAAGCAIRTDHRRGKVTRRMAIDDPNVNEEWNCDKGRWAFQYAQAPAAKRITRPMIRDRETGELRAASWPEALAYAADGLNAARGRAASLIGGRLTLEDAYAYSKFTRLALESNDIDFRARPHSEEEAEFLAGHIAGSGLATTYADLDAAPAVLLVGFEPEEESPIVFLRLRKNVLARKLAVTAIAPFATRGLDKLRGSLLKAAPLTEPAFLAALADGTADSGLDANGLRSAEGLRKPGSVILAGERLASVPGALTAAVKLAETTGAKLAWIPRRAGERGALEAGALPNLLPGGRPITDPDARAEVAAVWGTASLPSAGFDVYSGRDADDIVDAAQLGRLAGLVVAGVDPYDLPDPEAFLSALDRVPCVVSLEFRHSAVTERAHVVFPVAAVAEKSGTFVDWEGRPRTFETALDAEAVQAAGLGEMPDLRVLDRIADAMDVHLGLPTVGAARHELARLGTWKGERTSALRGTPADLPKPAVGEAVLATWHLLLDEGSLQAHEPFLAGTRKPAVVHLSKETASEIGVAEGGLVSVATDHGTVTLPLAIADLAGRVVWLPANSPGSQVRRTLHADTGTLVRIHRAANDVVEAQA
jgi:NADH-quinone oxidoreductase subunit G